jgi:hypothetical protein
VASGEHPFPPGSCPGFALQYRRRAAEGSLTNSMKIIGAVAHRPTYHGWLKSPLSHIETFLPILLR